MEAEVIASDPNRTVIPGFLVDAVVECRYGAHPSPVQGYYKRDDAFFRQYHEQTKSDRRQRRRGCSAGFTELRIAMPI